MKISDESKVKMQAAIEHLKSELKSIRTGRANSSMLDNVTVEIYNSPMRIKEIASITTPEARQLLITPFDPKNSSAIGKAIEKANLGFTPIVEGNLVRLIIPQMDATIRKEMVKLCHKKREETKVSIRNIRQEANKVIKKKKSEGEIPEDEMKKLEKSIQDLTDKYCKEADDLSDQKEKEVTHI